MENADRNINQNIMPEFHILPQVGKRIKRFVMNMSMLPPETDYSLSEHRGASAMLDEALDYQPELPFEQIPVVERTDLGQLGGGWDESGNYISFVPGREA